MMTLARRRGCSIILTELLRSSSLASVVVAHSSPIAFLTLRSSRSHWRFSIVAERITPAVSSACYKQPRSGEPRGRKGSLWDPSLAEFSIASFVSSSSPTPEQIETVCGETETEETIKKSRFIGRCGHASTFEEAKSFLQRVLQQHPKARHSCWAWRGLGAEHRFSDDGEPGESPTWNGGSANPGRHRERRPEQGRGSRDSILRGHQARNGRTLSGLWWGCETVLTGCRETRRPMMRIRIKAPVDSVGGVYHAVSDCERLAEEFTADGSVIVKVAVELSLVEEVRRRIQDATRGAAEIVEDETGSFGD